MNPKTLKIILIIITAQLFSLLFFLFPLTTLAVGLGGSCSGPSDTSCDSGLVCRQTGGSTIGGATVHTCVRGNNLLNTTMPKFNIPDIKLQIDIPGLNLTKGSAIKCTEENGKKVCNFPWIGEYIAGIYKYAIGIVGILAAVVLMIGGVLWIVAGGSATMIGEAKAWIGASLTGLVIALTSYVILYQVNPALVGFKGLSIQLVDQVPIPENVKEFAAKCKPTENGECAVSKMTIFGNKAQQASAICMAESSGIKNANNPQTKCSNGDYYAVWGLFQFNLSANYLINENDEKLNCPDAFGNKAWVNSSPTCTITDIDLYNKCVTAASNPAIIISNAKRLAGSGWGPWEANSKWCKF